MSTPLPNIGPIYEIIESDVIEFMEHRLKRLEKTGELAKINAQFNEQAIRHIEQPKKVVGIKNTVNPRKFYYDPTVSAPFDLQDANGRIFHRKGDQVNPLDTVKLMSNLIFIDGANNTQINWMLKEDRNVEVPNTIILVNGKPIELMKRLEKMIYFDQHGLITKKLGITQVPAKVSQEDYKLLIEEIKVD